jgi:hypothetical protein
MVADFKMKDGTGERPGISHCGNDFSGFHDIALFFEQLLRMCV